MVEQQNINWALIREQLPYERTPEQLEKRKQLWRQTDVNSNGIVSLAELDKALRDVMHCYQVFDCKPCIIRAFTAAKRAKNRNKEHGDYYIDSGEFRLVLQYLRQYFEYFQAFARIDTGDDRRIDRNEFRKGMQYCEQFGVRVKDPDAEFKKIDKNGGGQILFDEFCDWAIDRGLDLHDDDEDKHGNVIDEHGNVVIRRKGKHI